MSIDGINARLMAFLSALPAADPNRLVSPPGIGGLWRARHITAALKRQVLVVHHTGEGLAFVIPKAHGVCKACAVGRERSFCSHCGCSLCTWEREVEEHASPLASPAKVKQLAGRLKVFRFIGPPVPGLID